ncbi:MAG: response regulator transcription factor, partial [Desulfuromonadales bacterium]
MKRPRLLLVEDEVHIAQGLIYNLEQEGYQVTHAETGDAAMARFASQPFDVVILDLMLPDSHGIELCREMRKSAPQLPILMLTALGEEQDRINGLKAGADDYLTKPFSLDEFLLRVLGMLRRSAWYLPQQEQEEAYQFGSNRIDLRNL